ncbi:hypothetical protein HPB51_019462 [Rhipicephalus microplus]|uniref:CCHC-type domain-containing protein n=1 Tax=Rhipicephalus microplus TaxID=6941 RepID=A0A9J6DBL3_RHIMP|nr:hypothetical protein HPB51_019462 [Rhipicephalus microplus]
MKKEKKYDEGRWMTSDEARKANGDFRSSMATKGPFQDTLASVAEIIQHCRTFETLTARRITPKFGRLANVTAVASVDVPPTSSCDLASTIRQIVREELGRRDAINPPRASAINTSPPYDAMCAAVDATLYDVPQTRAPKPPTYNLHHRRGFHNTSRQPPTMASSWDDHRYMAPRGRFYDVREAPVCYNCGLSGHVALFCGQRRRPQQCYYEGSPACRLNRWRGGMRSMRDAYVEDGFQQTTNSDIHMWDETFTGIYATTRLPLSEA